jgi:uncharacterized membrane protein
LVWESFALVVTLVVAYAVLGDARTSLKLTLIAQGIKVLLFWGHERIWMRVKWGKVQPTKPRPPLPDVHVNGKPVPAISPMFLFDLKDATFNDKVLFAADFVHDENVYKKLSVVLVTDCGVFNCHVNEFGGELEHGELFKVKWPAISFERTTILFKVFITCGTLKMVEVNQLSNICLLKDEQIRLEYRLEK